jgi:hypothetical protein
MFVAALINEQVFFCVLARKTRVTENFVYVHRVFCILLYFLTLLFDCQMPYCVGTIVK